MHLLEGRQIIVTGAAGGIGSLVAAELRQGGAHVIGIDRVPCLACHETILGDLGNREGIDRVADAASAIACDTLVNLAGVQYFGPFPDQPSDALWAGYIVNLIAPAMLARALLPAMLERDTGHIVNIGSVLGSIPFAHFASYSSAKSGLKALSDALRRELADTPIAITHVSPRAVKTNLATPKVVAFAAATGMRMDSPGSVAKRIVVAIKHRERDVVIGFPESLLVRLNVLAPRLLDRALATNDRKAARLFC